MGVTKVQRNHPQTAGSKCGASLGPSAARTLASGTIGHGEISREPLGLIRGAREHGEEGPLARGARQGVQMDLFAGEPSK